MVMGSRNTELGVQLEVELLASVHKALCSIHSTTKKKKSEEEKGEGRGNEKETKK